MPSIDQASLSLKWCFHLVDALWRNGVREAFISPGSRSTPITLALVHHSGIRCHSVLDERAASYMALGAAKASLLFSANPAPALFVCTSGTALANSLPAVVEARMSATPLLVLSADRPPVLRATGASQTIDQIKIFGDYPVFFFDTGEPVDHEDDFRRLNRLGWQAVHFAMGRKGPVHLNLPFRKPLEPEKAQIRNFSNMYGIHVENVNSSATEPTRSLPAEILTLISKCRRPLAVAGPGLFQAGDFMAFCRNAGIPVLNEAGRQSGLNETHSCQYRINHHSLVLQEMRHVTSLAPDLIFRAGGDPVHRSTLKALSTWKVPQILLGDHPGRPDAALSVTHHLEGPITAYDFNGVATADWYAKECEHWKAYGQLWAETSFKAYGRLSRKLKKEQRLTDGHVYALLLPLIGSGTDSLVAVSNSFPIRDYLQFGAHPFVQQFPLLTNRGASGIDGVTSTAIGAALACSKPVTLFTGDLAFLHDAGSLNNLMTREASIRIIVLNNHGGTIFRMLPFDASDPVYIDYFETPQQVALSDIARAHGIPFASADSPSSLAAAWDLLMDHQTAILECQTHTEASMGLRTSL